MFYPLDLCVLEWDSIRVLYQYCPARRRLEPEVQDRQQRLIVRADVRTAKIDQIVLLEYVIKESLI